MLKKFTMAAVLIAATSLTVTACGSDDEAAPTTTAAPTAPAESE